MNYNKIQNMTAEEMMETIKNMEVSLKRLKMVHNVRNDKGEE